MLTQLKDGLALSLASSEPQSTTRWLSPVQWRWRDEAIGVVMVGFAGLLAVALLPHVLPNTPLVHLDQGRLHAGVGFVLCAIVLGILGAYWRALVSLGFAIALLGSIFLFAQQALATLAETAEADIRLVNFNVLGFNPRGDEVVDYLIAQSPDVAVVLESGPVGNHLERMEAEFPHHMGCRDGERCDLSLFSKHRFVDLDVIPFFTAPGRLVRAEIDVNGQVVTVLAAHLTKPYYGSWHAQQMQRLETVLADIEGPVILAGDFNSQAFVQAYRHYLIENAGMRLASRLQPTWPAFADSLLSLAGFAIDHVLIRGDIRPISAEVTRDPLGSNHHGLITTFDLDGN